MPHGAAVMGTVYSPHPSTQGSNIPRASQGVQFQRYARVGWTNLPAPFKNKRAPALTCPGADTGELQLWRRSNAADSTACK